MQRQIVLDTETTGLSAQSGHRLTEIGCVEIIDRKITGKTFQSHLNPERELDEKAAQITGLTWAKLRDKPRFVDIVEDLIGFIGDDELIIHNAQFDLSFLENELKLINHMWIKTLTNLDIVDTLAMSREKFPGQRNSLDALCRRYAIDNSERNLHGALLDAKILALVYLAMTAGQTTLDLAASGKVQNVNNKQSVNMVTRTTDKLKIIYASDQECAEHTAMMAMLQKPKK